MNIQTEVLELTPALAKSFIALNMANRPLSKVTVDKYSSAMKRGEWQLNGEPLIFFKNGNLGNGQHRLHAVVKSGVTIQVLLVRGIESSTFVTMDAGKVRGASDVLSLNNEKNTTKLAAGARAYIAYWLRGRAADEITSCQIIQAVENHEDLRYWANCYMQRKAMRVIPAAIIGFLTVASEKHGRETVGTFVEKVGSGVGLFEGDPALLLRERFIDMSNRKLSISKIIANALIIKAINAHIKGKRLGILRQRDGEAYPEIE